MTLGFAGWVSDQELIDTIFYSTTAEWLSQPRTPPSAALQPLGGASERAP